MAQLRFHFLLRMNDCWGKWARGTTGPVLPGVGVGAQANPPPAMMENLMHIHFNVS